MNKNSIRLAAFILIAVGTVLSCGNPFSHQSRTGSLRVSIPGAPTGSRDILPVAVSLDELQYDAILIRSGYSDISAVGQAYNGIQLSGIALGTWSLTVTGKLGGAAVFGATVDVTIVEGPNTIPVTLSPLQVGSGSLEVDLSWPDGLIDSADVYWTTDIQDVVTISTTKPSTKLWVNNTDYTFVASPPSLSINKSGIPSGSYYLIIELVRGGGVAASVIERVRVYDNRGSTKSISLSEAEISKPPLAPGGLGVFSRTAGSIVFEWLDNSNTETGFEFWNGSDWITGIVAGTTQYSVPAPLVSTTFSVRGRNSFGSSTTSDYTFNPYFVIYNANGSTSGSVPNDPWVYESDDMAVVMSPGTLAKSDYAFVGWNTAADGSGTPYAVGESFVLGTNNVVLFAQWEKCTIMEYSGVWSTTFDAPLLTKALVVTEGALYALTQGQIKMTVDGVWVSNGLPSPPTGTVAFTNVQDSWYAATPGQLYLLDGSMWQSLVTTPSGVEAISLAGLSGNPVMLGNDGIIRQWNGVWSTVGTAPAGTSSIGSDQAGTQLYALSGTTLRLWNAGVWTDTGISALPQGSIGITSYASTIYALVAH